MSNGYLNSKERKINFVKQQLHDARNCLKMSCKPNKVAYWTSRVVQLERELEELTGGVKEAKEDTSSNSPKLIGGRVNYYLVPVTNPQREDQPAYVAECEDIIQALGMTFDEGCLFKALWRRSSARLGNGKPGQKSLYDAEKILHYAGRILLKAKREED